MEASTTLELSEERINEIAEYLVERRVATLDLDDPTGQTLIHAPISLQPSPFDKETFENVCSLQLLMNTLIKNLMANFPRVRELLSDLASKDEFTGRLVKISEQVAESAYPQLGYLGVVRSDYMFDEESALPKMIEFNTIASSLGPLSTGVNKFHLDLIEKYNPDIDIEKIRKQKDPTEYIADGLKSAFDFYFGKTDENSDPDLGIMITIADRGSPNLIDASKGIDRLYEKHKIANVYVNWELITENCSVKEDGKLMYGDKEVAIAYFRTGYDPTQYVIEEDWEARLMVEKSRAIKCPSIDLHLLTVKKVQQELNRIEVWNEFCGPELDGIRQFFTGMYSLDVLNEETKEIIQDAKINHMKYVLKTQREGGGHNYFGEDIPKQLEKEDELWKYSLMERVFPVRFHANLIRNKVIWSGESVNELGIFGVLLVKFEENGTHTVLKSEEGG